MTKREGYSWFNKFQDLFLSIFLKNITHRKNYCFLKIFMLEVPQSGMSLENNNKSVSRERT